MKPLFDAVRPAARFCKGIYRSATSSIRLLPDFIIIGAQKGGTTSLYYYLVEHPTIAPASTKEVNFFDLNYHNGFSWYRAHFPSSIQKYYVEHSKNHGFITGEASPYYLFHPHAPIRIAKLLPQVKLIVLLRNPVDRAYSHYLHNLSRGREKLLFEDAISCEKDRIGEEYVDYLRSWFELFTREQMLVLKSEDFYADPAAIFQQTLAFLNVPILEPKRLKKGYKQYNKSQGTSSKMDSALRKRLVEYFEPHNARLCELLGRDFGWK